MGEYVYTMRGVGRGMALCVALVGLPAAAQDGPRVGVLTFTTLTQDFRDAFTEGLRAEGYAEGRNIRIEWRAADGRAGQAAQAAAELAIKHRIPAMTQQASFPDQSGLISYGIDFRQQYRRAAAFVVRILQKGEKPETMPIEQATTFELIVNRKTADALGLAIPQSLLLRATRVVE
jgi:putative ABC transport system substrate-binding protein